MYEYNKKKLMLPHFKLSMILTVKWFKRLQKAELFQLFEKMHFIKKRDIKHNDIFCCHFSVKHFIVSAKIMDCQATLIIFSF